LREGREDAAVGQGDHPRDLRSEFLALETCIRIMSRWGKQGIVSTERDGFVVRGASRLARLAEA
jgi:hypothetical protein